MALAGGDADEARTLIFRLGGGDSLTLIWPMWRPAWFDVLTRAALAQGDAEAAERWARQAQATADRLTLALPRAAALRARAAVASARGDHLGGRGHDIASAEKATEAGHRVEAARCRLEAGRALARASCRTEAVSALIRAEAEFTACGAEGHQAEAARELRRLGRRISDRRKAVNGLTEREVEVASLVSAGKTNREIAAALFISEKTIESHMAHIFRKLDVSSRQAVVQVLSKHH